MRNCLECTHCVLDYEADWSDVTPGNGLKCYCSKGHWSIEDDELGPRRLCEVAGKAEACEDYAEEPWAKLMRERGY